MRQLGEVIGVFAVFGERPHGVADPDHAVVVAATPSKLRPPCFSA